MGNSSDKQFVFYNVEDHPIDGKVTVYTIQGEGVFMMSKVI